MIPKMAFKFGANNFNFIWVRLGQVWLGWVRLCYLLLFAPQLIIKICDQHLKQPHYQHNICLNEVAYFSLIFTVYPTY